MLRHVAAGAAVSIILMSMPALAGSGSFSGASGHVTTGTAAVTKSGNQLVVELGKNFVLDGAPDPYVALGNGSRPVKGGLLAVLRKNKGRQSYSVAASPALEQASQVIIWCKKYGVPLGVATVK
jgi:hypothetical protein